MEETYIVWRIKEVATKRYDRGGWAILDHMTNKQIEAKFRTIKSARDYMEQMQARRR